jgi:hypothetical protein
MVIATSYDFIEKHNNVAGVDGRISVGPNRFEPGFHRNRRTFFIKTSYLPRREL